MMDFRVGDPVVHWTYGIGEIVGMEERILEGRKTLYYVVKIQSFSIYVPVDGKAISRLRPPTTKREFSKLFNILSGSGESLSEDRFERKIQLHKELADGSAENLCHVIRNLTSFSQKKQLNDDDRSIMNRAWTSLVGEWGFSMAVPPTQVEADLRRLLKPVLENVIV
jgi:CarD family transcriptional regulator